MTENQGKEMPIVAKPKVVLTHPDGREIVLEHFFVVGFSNADMAAEEDTNVEVVTTVNLDAMVFCEDVAAQIVDQYRLQKMAAEGTLISGPAAIVQMEDLKRKK